MRSSPTSSCWRSAPTTCCRRAGSGPTSSWRHRSPAIASIAVPVHEMPKAPQPAVREANARIAKAVPRTAQGIVAATTDGIHLTAEDYARWLAAIETAACGGG